MGFRIIRVLLSSGDSPRTAFQSVSRTTGLILLLTFLIYEVSSDGDGGSTKYTSSQQPQRTSSSFSQQDKSETGYPTSPSTNDICPTGESWCSSLDETEKLALEAIRSLHRQLDDDKNGNIDLAESDEFLREELKYEKNIENRQKAFHRNDDNQVSVRELWETWRRSEVHNWTIAQTAEWLITSVNLPHHQERFLHRAINGSVLPILAVNHNNFLTTVLGIKDAITRQRVAVKAMDVVLFGPPRDTTNRIKDVILTTLLALAVIACYLVYKRYQWAQEDLNKMARDMAELSKAEEALIDLQREIEKAKNESEKREKEAVVQRSNNIDGDDPEEVAKLREENMVLRSELHRAEAELQDKCWVSPPALQHWLQYTYELELKTYNKKKNGAEKQLKQAKDACDKLKKKRSSLMGAFTSTHGRSIDDVDKAILEARTSLTEITHELQERMQRWKQIENLVGCPIMNNPGMQYLENLLRVYGKPPSYIGPGSVISNSQDDIDDDAASSIYCPSAVHKLISTSSFMMYPGHQSPPQFPSASARVLNYQHQQSASEYSAVNGSVSNFGVMNSGGSARNSPCEICEISIKEKVAISSYCSSQPNSRSCQTSQNQSSQTPNAESTMISDEESVSGPTSQQQLHLSMARSKSVTSMLSLRERDRGISRESSSKESSTGEEEVIGEASDITNSRRVTFRADHRTKMKSYTNGRANGHLFDSMDNEESRRIVSRVLSQTSSVDSIKSKPEESQGTDDDKKEKVEEEPTVNTSITEEKEDRTVEIIYNKDNAVVKSNTLETLNALKSPKENKGKFWNTISNLVGNGKQESNKAKKLHNDKEKSEKKQKKIKHTPEVNGVSSSGGKKDMVIGRKSSSKRISNFFSSLRHHGEKSISDGPKKLEGLPQLN